MFKIKESSSNLGLLSYIFGVLQMLSERFLFFIIVEQGKKVR